MEKYEPICIIGKGNFGSISKIRRISDGKILVWKELDYGKMEEKDKHHIVSEVNILRELHHPNIVKYYDRIIDKKNTKIYIIMEYCSGGDIGQLIKRCRRNREFIDEEIIWKIFIQVILALNACHNFKEGKILHRDIKPSNVFLDNENNVKLGDFGLSRILSNESNFAYSNVGTPYYMSPEQIDDHKYNEKSDIWSLGCFLYEITSLHPPFEATNHLSLAMKIKSGKVEKINRRYSSFLNKIISLLMNTNPNNRPLTNELLNIPEISIRVREKKFKDNYLKMKKYEESLREREEKIKKKEKDLDLREKYLDEKEKNVKAREERVSEREEFIKKELSMKIKDNQINNEKSCESDRNINKNLNKGIINCSEFDNYTFNGISNNENLFNKKCKSNIRTKSDTNLNDYYNENYNIKRNKSTVIKQKPKLNFPSSTTSKDIYHKPINLTNNTSLNTINTNTNSVQTQSINNTNNNQIKTLIYPSHKSYYSIDVNSNKINLAFSPDSSSENIKKPPNLVYKHSKTHISKTNNNLTNCNNYPEEITSNSNYNQTHKINYAYTTHTNKNTSKLLSEINNEKNDNKKYIIDYSLALNDNNSILSNEQIKNISTISPPTETLKLENKNETPSKRVIPISNSNPKNFSKKNNNYSNTINVEREQSNFTLRKERNYLSSHNLLVNEKTNISYKPSKTLRQKNLIMPRNNSYNLTHNYRSDENCENHDNSNFLNTNLKNKKKNSSFRGNNNSKKIVNYD